MNDKDISNACPKLVIAVWNVQSIQNKYAEVLEHIIDCSADVVLLSETWLTSQTNDVTAYVQTRGYYLKHIFRQDDVKSRGGGVGVLCRKKYKLNILKSIKYQSFEHCIFSITKNKHDKVVFVAVYRLGHVPVTLFHDEFPQLLESLCSMNCLLFIGGDVNIHLNNPEDSNAIAFRTLLDSFDLHLLVEGTTQKKGNMLDCLISNEPDKCSNSLITDVGLSDHFLITSSVDYCPKTVTSYKTISYRKVKEINMDAFSSDLSYELINLKNVMNEDNFGNAITIYNDALTSVLDSHAPLCTATIKDVQGAPWFDSEYIDMRRKRRKAEKLWHRTKLQVHKESFIKLRKQTTALAHNKKVYFCRKSINEAANNNKALYANFNRLVGYSNDPIYPSSDSDVSLANEFASHYTNKVKKIRHEIESKSSLVPFESDFANTLPNITFLHNFDPTTDAEIEEIIKKHGLKCGFNDPMPEHLLRGNSDLLIPVWTYLVNLSLQNGSMDCLKHADIIPILKEFGLDTEIHNNFRPVSHLQFIGKLIERVVLKRLNKHLINNNLNIPNQYGYKPGHSTETILIKITNDLLIASDRKTATVLLLLDLSAAFDTVNVDILLNILCQEIGIKDIALQWFRSFLTNRTMRVKVNNSFSETFILQFGIPQGSVLGPVLFNIYVRSIYRHIEHHGFEVKGFADDHQLYVSFAPTYQYFYLGEKINEIMNVVTQWMNSFFLKLNPNKTKIIVFGPKKVTDLITIHGTFIKSDNSCIRFSKFVKNLGVLFDSALTFSNQVKSVVSSVFATIRSIARIGSFLTKKEKTILVCSLVLSKLDYCNSLYSGIDSSLLAKLQYAQNSAARLIYRRRKYDHVSDILKDLHWLPVKVRIQYKVLLLVHKALYNLSPDEINSLITFESTRTFNLQIQRVNSAYGDRAFSITSAKLWNTLPLQLKTETDTSKFKKRLKTYLFATYYI